MADYCRSHISELMNFFSSFPPTFALLLLEIQGSGKVKEREVGTSPLRLQVTDRDAPHTPAWRAKYTVHGAAAGHFQVETDGESNDGILTVVKVRAAGLHVAETTASFKLRVIYNVHARLSAPVSPDCSPLNTQRQSLCCSFSQGLR